MLYLMAKILNSKRMKNSLRIGVIFLLFSSFIQDSTIKTIENVKRFSKDRYENVFYINTSGDLKKVGDNQLIYSPQKRREFTNLEAWNSIKIFLFSREFQEFTVVDKYLTEMYTKGFSFDVIGFADYATLALDGNLWVFDNVDYTLKKVDTRTGNLITSTNLNLVIDEGEQEVLHMREYGNFIYISTVHNGILVFDNLGTYKKKLPFNNVSFFDFNKDELYFLENSKLGETSWGSSIFYFNLLSLESRNEPISQDVKHLIISDKSQFISY